MMAFANELQLMKDNANVTFDKISHADYAVTGAMTTITWAGGPVMLDDFFYGRKDATSESECNAITNFPTAENYKDNMMAKGFTAEQVVALANCEAFGVVRSPENERWSTCPRFDNYYYQALLTSSDDENLPLQRALMGNDEMRGIVEKFAGDKEEFFKVFKTAFVQLCELGYSTETDLVDIEKFLLDEPGTKLRFMRMFDDEQEEFNKKQ